MDATEDVYASSLDGPVEKLSSTGSDLGQYGVVPNGRGIAFDSAGNLLVASTDKFANGTTVYAIAPGGGTVTTYAIGFNGPSYIATALPEPAAIGLIGCFVWGLIGARRRRPSSHRV